MRHPSAEAQLIALVFGARDVVQRLPLRLDGRPDLAGLFSDTSSQMRIRDRGRRRLDRTCLSVRWKRAGVRSIAYDAQSNPTSLAQLDRAVAATKLVVPLAAEYPLGHASKAHAREERGHVLGRIALTMR